jgi:hypothetical protein
MVAYAVVELSLHVTKYFLRCLGLALFLSVCLSARVLPYCEQFLSDIQEVRSQLLQLTAGNAHQCPIKGRHPVEETRPWNSSDALKNKGVNIKIYAEKQCRNIDINVGLGM